MAFMFSDALNLCRSILNASTTYGTNDDVERHPDPEITDAIRAADGLIYSRVASIPNHPLRVTLLMTASQTHGALVPFHEGALGAVKVDGKAADWMPRAEVDRLRDNPLGLIINSRYYCVEADRIYFNGTSATVDYVPKYTDSGSTLQTPQPYFYGVVAKALAILFAKEGSETPTAQHFAGLGDMVDKQIDMSAQNIDPLPLYAMAKG